MFASNPVQMRAIPSSTVTPTIQEKAAIITPVEITNSQQRGILGEAQRTVVGTLEELITGIQEWIIQEEEVIISLQEENGNILALTGRNTMNQVGHL